nr:MAG: nonstructural protein [Lake Sinai virus 8]
MEGNLCMIEIFDFVMLAFFALYHFLLAVWLLVISRRLFHTMAPRGSYSAMLATECLRVQLQLAKRVAEYLGVECVYVFDTDGFFDAASVHVTTHGLRYRTRDGIVAVLSQSAQAILPRADPNVFQQIARRRLTPAEHGLCLHIPLRPSTEPDAARDRGRDEVDG